MDGNRPRGGGQQGRGWGRNQSVSRQPPTQNQPQGQASPQHQIANETAKGSDAEGTETESSGGVQDKNLQVVCFNCGEIGHLSSACRRPRVCFICQSTNHVVDLCPEWKKPPVAAQYYGSANRGLGFYLIDVEARGNRFKHWNGLDNFGIMKIEEGEIDEKGILENLKELFDVDWPWQLKKTRDGKFIIRFPPDKKVEKLVIGKQLSFI